MADAIRDQNNIETLMGVDKNNGKVTVNILADPVTHRLKLAYGTSGIDYGNGPTPRDSNFNVALSAVSSVDGKTPVAIYADSSTGELLAN